MKKILISLPEDLLKRVDQAANAEDLTRSGFVRDALNHFLAFRHKLEIEERMKRGYEEMAAINLQWARIGQEADELTYRAYEDALCNGDEDDMERRDL